MPRVLIGEFGAIATLGLRELLEERCEIVGEGAPWGDIVTRIRETTPDALVVDADLRPTLSNAAALADGVPGLTVVGCSLRKPTLHVFSSGGVVYTTELSPSSLLDALNLR